MKKETVFSWILIGLSVVLTVVAYIVLPDTVVTQISVGSDNASTMPKILAVLIPFALGVGGAIAALLIKGDAKSKMKSLIVSVVGIVVFIFMFVFNL